MKTRKKKNYHLFRAKLKNETSRDHRALVREHLEEDEHYHKVSQKREILKEMKMHSSKKKKRN